MIAEQLFGDIIFALKGVRPKPYRGWVKKCTTETNWIVAPRKDSGTRECDEIFLQLEKCNGS